MDFLKYSDTDTPKHFCTEFRRNKFWTIYSYLSFILQCYLFHKIISKQIHLISYEFLHLCS